MSVHHARNDERVPKCQGLPERKEILRRDFTRKYIKNDVKESFEDLSKHFLEYFLRMEDFFFKTVSVRQPLMPLQVSMTVFGWAVGQSLMTMLLSKEPFAGP